MKRYLVTGGNGFIGHNLVKFLLLKGHSVRVTDLKFDNLTDLKGDLLRWPCDISQRKGIDWHYDNVDGVIHLAYINGTRFFYEKPYEVLRVATMGMLNVLDFCEQWNIPELYLASSSEVYQTPEIIPTPEDISLVVPRLEEARYSYGGGKIISELLAYHSKISKIVIFRPHNVYGPGITKEHVVGSFISRMLAQSHFDEFSIMGTGQETRSFVNIADIVNGIYILLQKGENRQVYNIGDDYQQTILHVAETIAELTNTTIDKYTFTAGHSGSTSKRCPDISKIRQLGYNPKIDFRQGLLETIEWIKTHGIK